MFDSHCHLHGDRMWRTVHDAVSRARAAGVTGFCLAGVQPDGWRRQIALAQQIADCGISYGVHPQLVAHLSRSECRTMIAQLEVAARGDRDWPRPQAIGEIGLDSFTEERKAALPLQEEAFVAQLRIARETGLPVILHVLGRHGRALEILRREGIGEAGGVMHSYSGSAELVREYVALGLSISFAGSVTKRTARKVRAAAAVVPADRLLVETDSPDQTPEEYLPAPNEPAFLPAVVAAVAAARGEAPEAVARLTEDNARRLYAM